MSNVIKVEKNVKYGDYRVALYVNGELDAEWDGNWSKAKANAVAKQFVESSGLEFFGLE